MMMMMIIVDSSNSNGVEQAVTVEQL